MFGPSPCERKGLVAFISLVVFLGGKCLGAEQGPFVKEGELWLGEPPRKITHTGRKLADFAISPSGKFLAAKKQIGEVEGIDATLPEGKKAAMTPTWSILVLDLGKKKVIHEILPPEELLHPGQWREGDLYRFGVGSLLDVIEMYEFDPKTGQTRKLKFDNETGEYR